MHGYPLISRPLVSSISWRRFFSVLANIQEADSPYIDSIMVEIDLSYWGNLDQSIHVLWDDFYEPSMMSDGDETFSKISIRQGFTHVDTRGKLVPIGIKMSKFTTKKKAYAYISLNRDNSSQITIPLDKIDEWCIHLDSMQYWVN